MSPFRINIFYSSLLIAVAVFLMTDSKMVIVSFWQAAPLLFASFGLILFPISKALKRQSDTAQVASMLITGTVGAIALSMLIKVQQLSNFAEPLLIVLTLISFIVVGIYIGSLKRS